jgi:hypothetical protein
MGPTTMKLLAALLLCVNTFVAAQDAARKSNVEFREATDTIFADTEPVDGYEALRRKLEKTLSAGDTTGKKHMIRLDNIGFVVSTIGKIDSAWIIFHRRPIHYEIIRQLKATPWRALEKDGMPVPSRQELHLNIYLTKAVLKKHGYWPSFGERLFAPWID